MVWNILSFFPEYFVLHSIYNKKTELIKNEQELKEQKLAKPNPFATAIKSWRDYYKHVVCGASLAYVMLYITVLSPGALMTVKFFFLFFIYFFIFLFLIFFYFLIFLFF